jgi:hypothetical protein
MAWTPQRAYFAVIALPADRAERAVRLASKVPPLVLLTGDDFADVLKRRATLLAFGPGHVLQVVWALDGEPVTREQMEAMLYERAPAAGSLRQRPAGAALMEDAPALGPLDRLLPTHPRALRPDASPTPRPPRPIYESQDERPAPTACPSCKARIRTLLVAGEPPPCDSLGHHAPSEDQASSSSPL